MCVAVDANMMVLFQRERVLGEPGRGSECLERILQNTYLALDDGDLCVIEYYQTLPGILTEELKSWITQAINDRKLRLLPFGNFRDAVRRCRQAGLPQRDHRWVKLCSNGCVTHFLTDDIDFYEPRVKNGTAQQKHRAKVLRRGSMIGVIERETNIQIFCPDHLDDYFPDQIIE
jgi:hypothetical protein